MSMPAEANPLHDSWLLQQLGGDVVERQFQVPLTLQENSFFGSDGCNRISGSYSLKSPDGISFSTSRMGSTMMGCEDHIMAFAGRYIAHLERARRHRVADGKLEFIDDKGERVATFARQPRGLNGTRWQLMGYNNGRQAVTSTLSSERLSLSIAADGRVTVTGHCRSYTGTASYVEAEGSIRFDRLAAGAARCKGPKELVTEERLFVQALRRTTRYERSAEVLDLHDDKSARQANFRKLDE